MVFERLGAYVVACHGQQAPGYDVWDSFLSHSLAGTLAGDIAGFLIVSDGGGPNAMQRRQLEMLMRSHGITAAPPSAIVTDSWTARQLAIVVSWFNPATRAFAKRDIEKAFDFLGAPADERPNLHEAVTRLQTHLRQGPAAS